MWRQWILVGSSLVVAAILQVAVLSRLGLPGATPDLVLVTVVALALALGPLVGAVSGFVGGVLVALAPPFAGPLGVNAIVYLVIGLVVAGLVDRRDRTVPLTIALVAGSVALATVVIAAVDALLGRPEVPWHHLFSLVLTTAAYAAILAPAVVPGIAWLARKLEPVAPAA